MQFIKKYWWIILIAVVAIFLFVRAQKAKAAQAGIANTTISTLSLGRPSVATASANVKPATSTSVGTPSGGTVMTRSQCKQTCRGLCGRRCAIPVGKRCKTTKTCWDNCKNTYCQWVTGELEDN